MTASVSDKHDLIDTENPAVTIENTRKWITQFLEQHDNIEMTTSVDRIATILGYLARCDHACANSSEELDEGALSGRGFLLEMLSESLGRFAENFEQLEDTYAKQQGLQNYQQQNQLACFSEVNEKYQQLLALDDQDTAEAQQLQQQIANLNTQLNIQS